MSSIYEIGKCDYCHGNDRILRPTPFLADGLAMTCKTCWDMIAEEIAPYEEVYLGKFEEKIDG